MPDIINVGGGGYVPRKYYLASTIPIGSSGVLVNLSNLNGKRVRLEGLISSGGIESDIRVLINGEALIEGNVRSANSDSTTQAFNISQVGSLVHSTNGGFSQSLVMLSDVVGLTIQVEKVTGTTTNNLLFFYSEEE